MATFDQLSAEQRAIIELVLKQGKSYDQLSDMLGLPSARVRALAREALVRLSPVSAAAVEDDRRDQLGDYLLHQQAVPESTATREHLQRSEAARGWARSVLDSLEQFYDESSLPTIPEAERGRESEPRRARRERAAARPRAELSPEARAALLRRWLLGAGAALLAVLVIFVWPIGVGPLAIGGDDSQSADQDQSAGQDEGGGEGGTDKQNADRPQNGGDLETRAVAQLELQPVEGLADSDQEPGAALILQRGNDLQIVVSAPLPRTKRSEAYQVWLYNNNADAVSLGANQVDQSGRFEGAGRLPAGFDKYKFIDVSQEPIRGPDAHSGTSVLRGRLSQLAPVSPNQGAQGEPGAGQGDVPSEQQP